MNKLKWRPSFEIPEEGRLFLAYMPLRKKCLVVRLANVRIPSLVEITMAGVEKWVYLEDALKYLGLPTSASGNFTVIK